MPIYHESQHSVTTDKSILKAAWWREPEKTMHEALVPIVRQLAEDQADRDRANLIYYSMYDGAYRSSLDGAGYARRRTDSGLSVNLTGPLADTVTSKIAKNKPRIMYMTEGGDWSQQARGKRLTKAINGAFGELSLYEVMQAAYLDSCVLDLGSTQFYREGDKVKCERVMANEQRIDYIDGRYGKPRSRYKIRQVAREVLIEQYPDCKGKLKETKRAECYSKDASQAVSDMVDVWEALHLPSASGAKDGKHVICVENATLLVEPWGRSYFPYVDLRWQLLPYGFYGKSIAAQVARLQYSANKRFRDIEEHADLATGYVAVEAGSRIDKADFTNEVMRIIEFTNTAPQYISPATFSPEKMALMQWVIQRAHDETGISSSSASSKKPDGLDSGKALREWNDLESERFQMNQQRYENAFVDAAEIITDLYEEIYADNKKLKVRSAGSKLLETIDWAKCRMDREQYVVRAVPTSFLPSTPAAKYATVQEMMQAELISRDEAMLLLDYPDLERVASLRNAPYLYYEMVIENLLDPDVTVAKARGLQPEPIDKHELGLDLCLNAYNDARQKDAPEKNLELMREYITKLQRLIEKKQQPAAAALPPPGQQPQLAAPEQMAPPPM